MLTEVIQIAKGIGTAIPGIRKCYLRVTGGTVSARYCYSVWMRHLSLAQTNGCLNSLDTVAELGPGDSLGIGLAALLSGAKKYYAFDVVHYASYQKNLSVFEELIELFRKRTPIPNEHEFIKVKPQPASFDFPSEILTEARLSSSLSEARLQLIRNAIVCSKNDNNEIIKYYVPWNSNNIIADSSVDMIFSQAVMEHVEDLQNTYAIQYRWLKPTGFISHQIDFKCHGTASVWNGHWRYSDFIWKLIKGNRCFLINRQPYSTHQNLLKLNNFSIIYEQKRNDSSRITSKQLSKQFRKISQDDLTTSGCFIQAIKNSTI